MIRRYFRKLKTQCLKRKLKLCGDKVYIANDVQLSFPKNIVIENNVQIFSQNHYYDGTDLKLLPYDDRYVNKKVIVDKYVWVGASVLILPGVHIGEGAIIGAGAVVTKNVPPYAVVGGNPATVLKYRDAEIFQKLKQESKGYIKGKKY